MQAHSRALFSPPSLNHFWLKLPRPDFEPLPPSEPPHACLQGKSKGKARPGKVTQFEIAQRKSKLAELETAQDAARELAHLNLTSSDTIDAMIEEGGNANRAVDEGEVASTIDGALELLSGGGSIVEAIARRASYAADADIGQHAEKLAAQGKLTYKLFESYRMPTVKVEKPGLKGSQYRDHIKKEWKKSVMNPANMAEIAE